MRSMHANRETRANAIRQMQVSSIERPLDILVIGGGVTGAGIALDSASRGLRTAVVEAQDWASGTSSRSSKLVHGGLRYLQMLDFKLVREALAERDLLLTQLAPHLVRPVPFLYPLTRPVWDRVLVGAGIGLYDVLASMRRGARALPWHRHLSRAGLARVYPGLRRSAAVGAIQYWDANVDDARLVTSLLRTAIGHGAYVASRVQVIQILKDDNEAVTGAMLLDLETGLRYEVRAKRVISATGVWTGETQALAADDGLNVLASKGVHIVVPRERITGDPGIILQTASSVLFLIPWSRYWVIGTTDTPWDNGLRHPVPNARDIDYVLQEANSVLAKPLSHEDIVGTWAGLRPLLQPESKIGTATAKVSREHTVASPATNFFAIAGGKLTTYRVMAKDAVDFALGAEADRYPSRTDRTPLVGAGDLAKAQAIANDLVHRFELPASIADHLVHRYGVEVADIAEICATDRVAAQTLGGAPAYLRAEIIFAIRAEGALHLDDLMERRTRINYEYSNWGMDAVEEVASIATAELGWSAEDAIREITAYRGAAVAYSEALRQEDDESAAAARGASKDLLPFRPFEIAAATD